MGAIASKIRKSNKSHKQNDNLAEGKALATNKTDAISPSAFPNNDKSQSDNSAPESAAARLNRRTVEDLQYILNADPEADLKFYFPANYTRRMRIAGGPSTKIEEEAKKIKPDNFLTKLDICETATVVYDLSDEVASLLSTHGNSTASRNSNTNDSLLSALKSLLWDSPKLWESPIRGVVVKCSDRIAAKIIRGTDYTEYTALQYLEKHVPEIPAPRPHGLVRIEPFRVVFMSCIDGMTLTKAWPTLSHEQKLSVQTQLDSIFSRLRSHAWSPNIPLGGLGGEGVKDWRCGVKPSKAEIKTPKAFEDFQFSANPHIGGRMHISFLHQFLDGLEPNSIVLTHGDVRKDNIMVEVDNGLCRVTGLIDWEDGGFYPEQHECIAMTGTMSMVQEDDWYLYLPKCISPYRFPVHWLVDRLWGMHFTRT